jgi:hypothetical protein
MLEWRRGVMTRRSAICRVQIEGQGLRRGLRRFCSPAHLQRHVDAEDGDRGAPAEADDAHLAGRRLLLTHQCPRASGSCS